MTRLASICGALLAGSLASAGCGKPNDMPNDKPPPAPPIVAPLVAPPLDLPDPHTVDWQNLRFDVGSLGTVKATAGRAEFHVVEDDLGQHATQGPATGADWPGFLDVEAPIYTDLDGDGHDEAVIAFELKSAQLDDTPHVFGVFVFTLRDGLPRKLATITTSTRAGFKVSGATITTTEGASWRWDRAHQGLVEARP